MSDYGNRPNGAAPDPSGPGKRLERGAEPPLGPEEAKRRRERRIMIIMIVLAAVMVIAAVGMLLYNRWFKKPSLPPGPVSSGEPATSLQPGETPGPTLDIDAIQPKVGGERKSDSIYTFLVFGTDVASGLTDTMMVVTYDVANQRAAVMSLPRDTLINVRRWNKSLNAVYSSYKDPAQGVEALKSEVSELVGFTPDYYVKIDWELVGEMVDAIGGVWFDNPYHMQYYDPHQDLDIYQPQGYRLLWGSDAMQVVRWRHNDPGIPYNPGVSKAYAASDLERLAVQHAFLKAVLKQTLQIGNITRIGQLIELFNSRVNSDLAVENMLWFGQEAVLGGLKVDDVEFCTMPNALGVYGKESFVYPIQSQLLTLINSSLNPYVEQVTIRQLDLMSVAPNGGLRSSTGRLAAPSLANPPAADTPAPVESEPAESGPVESDPLESGELPSAPAESEPAESGPEPTPAPTPAPEETRPAWLDPVADGGGAADWGYTPD